MDDHIHETELALFAFDPNAVPEPRRKIIIAHTGRCAECRADLDFFTVAEEDLADADVWELSVGSATLDTLRAYAERIAAEDAEADEMLAPFFASPVTAAWRDIRSQRRFLTGGVVRRLNAQAHSVFESEPLDALTLADAAIAVAEVLPEDTYPGKAVFELRGTAWKERANAQLMLGQLQPAFDSLARAERAYRQLPSPSLGLATVALVRAGVLYQQQRLEEAAAIAGEAERGFAHFGDNERRMSALYLRGGINYEMLNFATAMLLFQQLIDYGEEVNNPMWIARGSYALGDCYVDRGDLGEATLHFHRALMLFREVGPPIDRVRTEWSVARVFLHSGKLAEAIRRLRDVESEFETRGMVTDAALVGLDMADALLALGQYRQIVDVASRLFRVFMDAGMLTSALTAIAYIKDAAASETLTKNGIDTVRKFLRRAERQPEILFVPPPQTPT